MSEVIKWPDPRLEQKAEPVEHGERCRELIEEMFASLGPTGIGLAAPQLGIMKRIIVIKVPLRGLGQHQLGNFVKHAVINPTITWYKPGLQEAMESCLSFPGREVSVFRWQRITVEGFDVKWNPIKIGAKDLVARVLQHEIDHLEGRTLAFYALKAHEAEQATLAKANEENGGCVAVAPSVTSEPSADVVQLSATEGAAE